ncbi:Uncharacterized protein APZ42_008068 [Daphnia magna]|uniref:Uncharacterized protein n=1 Tax=Daphnia magna TaxID=35525 RepID=A0A164EW05_9CRUS|nr:Uncharacterized protein APZ42_008068 [Daphnia magna]
MQKREYFVIGNKNRDGNEIGIAIGGNLRVPSPSANCSRFSFLVNFEGLFDFLPFQRRHVCLPYLHI